MSYRPVGQVAWDEGQDLWYDAITGTRQMNQYRGSLVNLRPGTRYEVKLKAGNDEHILTASTWREDFKVKKTIRVGSSATFTTTEGGSAADGYVLYDGTAATIDQQANAANLATIKHSHVIVRGLRIINAERDALAVQAGLTDVVIERCDISNWGSQLRPSVNPAWGKIEAGIRVDSSVQRVILQRNRVHHPRYTATRWNEDPADVHPRGPRPVFLGKRSDDEDWEANHVVRYNEFTSDQDHLFEDVIGGGRNWSQTGHPGRDSDIYGNIITHATDDLIEADGGGLNVRIWGNYLSYANVMISLQSCTLGPVYIFRNVFGHNLDALLGPAKPTDSGFKFRGNAGVTKPTQRDYAPFRGRVYVYHNTRLFGEEFRLGYGLGYKDHVRNVVSRNNILPAAKFYLQDTADGSELHVPSAAGDQGAIIEAMKAEAKANPSQAPFNPDFLECSFDYDLTNRPSTGDSISRVLGPHLLEGDPRWRDGHGPVAGLKGNYQLASSAPGRDAGADLPSFNSGRKEEGGAADMGAHEFDSPPMQFGVDANWVTR